MAPPGGNLTCLNRGPLPETLQNEDREQIPSCQIYSLANPARFAQSRPGPSLPHLCLKPIRKKGVKCQVSKSSNDHRHLGALYGRSQANSKQSRWGWRLRPAKTAARLGVRRMSQAQVEM